MKCRKPGIDATILENNELIPIIEINGRFTLSTYVSFVQEKKKLANAVLFSFYTKIPLVSYNNYSGLKNNLKKKTSGIKTIMDCLYIIQNLLRSVELERMAECLVYFLLMRNMS